MTPRAARPVDRIAERSVVPLNVVPATEDGQTEGDDRASIVLLVLLALCLWSIVWPRAGTWMKLDQHLRGHRKWKRSDPLARLLWVEVGLYCCTAASDVIDAIDLGIVAREAGISNFQKHAKTLVREGLWHDHLSACDRCEPTPEGWFRFHDWWEYQFTDDETKIPVARMRRKRRADLLRDKDLCQKIQQRDRGLCRYCGVRVKPGDQRSPYGFTYDHVDPAGENTFRNVVTACRGCNGAKRDRTPDECGVRLLRAGTLNPDSIPGSVFMGVETSSSTVRSGSETDSIPGSIGGSEDD